MKSSPCFIAVCLAVLSLGICAGRVPCEASGPAPFPPQNQAGLEQQVEEAMELFGVKRQIEQIPALLQLQLQQQKASLEPEVYAATSQALLQSYQPETLYATLLEHFRGQADSERLTAALEWLRSPLARKITDLEAELGTPEGQQKLREFASGLQANPPAQERLALVVRMDEATKATELTVSIVVAIAQSLLEGIQSLRPAANRMSQEETQQAISNMRGQLQGPMKNNTLVSFLFMYRFASDEELAEYVQFWESDVGQWFGQAASEAFLEAMAAAARDAGRRIAETATPAS